MRGKDKFNIIKIKDGLIDLHLNWHNNDRENQQFNYNYIRERNSVLIGLIERKPADIRGLKDAFELAGINPYCHLSGILYGNTKNISIRKKHFLNILYYLALEAGGYENLNDNSMNSPNTFTLPPVFFEGKYYPVCEKLKCSLMPITFRSVYARGRCLYGSWESALKAAGFNYTDIRRKKQKYPRNEVMNDLLDYMREEDFIWSIQNLRKHDTALYKGIFNSHESSPFLFANRPVMETAYLELRYLLKKESIPDLTPEKFYLMNNGK